MRVISILLSFVATLSAFAQTIEIVSPPVLDANHTGTWQVIVSNPGSTPTVPLPLHVSLATGGAAIVSVPPGCQALREFETVCPASAIAPGERRTFEYRIRLDGPYGMVITSARLGDFGAASANFKAVFGRPFPVTNTNDDGPGSLRQVIAEMNQSCIRFEPCQPFFRIDGPVPSEGWFTIRPLSPLPPITAPSVVVDGRTQAVHTGDTNPAGPEIMLDGVFTVSGHGLQFDGDDVTVTDLAAGHFPGNGINATASTTIRRCHLGMDPSGLRRVPNGTRGVQIKGGSIEITDSLVGGNLRSGGWFDSNDDVTIARNRFTGNGASGFYARTVPPGETQTHTSVTVEDNVITGNAHAGISVDRASMGHYAKNHFAGNLGRAIDIGIDGPTATVPGVPGRGGIIGMPAITSARYENGETVLEVTIAPRAGLTLGETAYFYASPVPKDGGELIGAVERTGGLPTCTLRVPRDLRGQWVSAATFANYVFGFDLIARGTSEISEPRLVE